MVIIWHVLIQIFLAYSLVCGDCGIPGVPAFARIFGISSDFNAYNTSYPEGYSIKYDCLTYGLNINGIDTRTCKNSEWEPWKLPYCGIDKLTDFVIKVKHDNKTDINGVFKNNLKLFSSKEIYLNTKTQLFALNVSRGNYLWEIVFAHDYRVEKDHSLLAVMVFVIPYTDGYNDSQISIDVESSISSSKRTCKTKVEVDYVSALFSDNLDANKINGKKSDKYFKIIMECRNNWSVGSIKWRQTTDSDVITQINANVSVNTRTEYIEMILTQLNVNVDCGYPDAPINSNYTKMWGNAVFHCISGQLTGNSNLSCNSDGLWNEKVAKCCVNDQCYVPNKLSVVWIVIITLSIVVLVLIVMAVVLIVRSVKRQQLANIERSKRQMDELENYDDIADDSYDQIDDQQYDEIDYSKIGGKCELELYDDNQLDARYTNNAMTKTVASNEEYGYVKMESFDDGYVQMTSNSGTVAKTDGEFVEMNCPKPKDNNVNTYSNNSNNKSGDNKKSYIYLGHTLE